MRGISLLLILLCLLLFSGCSYLNPFNWFGSDEPEEKEGIEIVEKDKDQPTIIDKRAKRMQIVADSLAAKKVENLGTDYEFHTVAIRANSGDSFLFGGKFGVKTFRNEARLIFGQEEIPFYTFKENQEKVWVIFNVPMKRIFLLDKKTNDLEVYNLKGKKLPWNKVEKVNSYRLSNSSFIVGDDETILIYDTNRKTWLSTSP